MTTNLRTPPVPLLLPSVAALPNARAARTADQEASSKTKEDAVTMAEILPAIVQTLRAVAQEVREASASGEDSESLANIGAAVAEALQVAEDPTSSPEQITSAVSQALQTVEQAAQGASSASSEGVFFSMAGMLLTIMLALMEFDLKMSNDFLKTQSNFAKVMGGIGANGEYVPGTGLVALQMAAAISAGNDAKDSLHSQAIGQFVSAGLGGLSIAGMGASHLFNITIPGRSLQTELKATTALRDRLDGPAAGGAGAGRAGAADAALQTRINELKAGHRLSLEHPDPNATETERTAFKKNTEDALDALKNPLHPDRAKVLENIEGRVDLLEKKAQSLYSADQSWTQKISTALQTGQGMSGGTGQFVAGTADAQKAADDATGQIDQTTLNQLSTTADQARDKSGKFQSDADQTAQAIANALAGMTRA